jgi:nitroreductase
MDVVEAIMTRRSIRKYTGQPISEMELTTIIKAGCSAPSAMNHQPWHFVVVREKSNLASVVKIHHYAQMVTQAGCCVIVCGDKEKQSATGFLIEDCSAAIQNMLLTAHGLGLGAVWCGLYPNTSLTKPMANLLHIPETVILVGLVAIGHKDEDKGPEDRYDPSKVHHERW